MNDPTAARPPLVEGTAPDTGLVMVDGDQDAGVCADGVCAVPQPSTSAEPTAGA